MVSENRLSHRNRRIRIGTEISRNFDSDSSRMRENAKKISKKNGIAGNIAAKTLDTEEAKRAINVRPTKTRNHIHAIIALPSPNNPTNFHSFRRFVVLLR